MIRDEVRTILAHAADFLREGDVTAALERANHALAVVEWLAPNDADLKDEVLLVRGRCETALANEAGHALEREQQYTVREENEAEQHI